MEFKNDPTTLVDDAGFVIDKLKPLILVVFCGFGILNVDRIPVDLQSKALDGIFGFCTVAVMKDLGGGKRSDRINY